MDKTGRNGLSVGDLLDKSFTTAYIKLRLKHQRLLDNYNFQEDISAWEEEFFEAMEFLRDFKIVNGEYFINEKIRQGKKFWQKAHREVCWMLILELSLLLRAAILFQRCVYRVLDCSPKNQRSVWGFKSLLYKGRKRTVPY